MLWDITAYLMSKSGTDTVNVYTFHCRKLQIPSWTTLAFISTSAEDSRKLAVDNLKCDAPHVTACERLIAMSQPSCNNKVFITVAMI